MSSKLDELFGYVQERCLWQFFSRTWDRQENIDGILATATDLLAGQPPRLETPMDRLFYADAKIMVADFRTRFPWFNETPPDEVRELIAGLKAKLEEIAITGSKNRELNHNLY
ncbi:Nitrogenase vanadium-iron protein delta chain [Rhodovastum atsumiense]|uniref:nitrogenase n=1 Tax=Rhodovastum atsumiense TaxID=504468 RepID=A0A5M6J0C4_9PROT|nr:V-containing nitrogenase subunit delta [Rhodovastum atsumiense]KAA5614056.1 V-containing nitrogenase subunit delta [Rhodovastum atsumiense]CAH2598871.1 Nitrogenase vanadium-iron protein delta chain [Rhodovastum atsumiense]